jgi:hypothetical protein
MPDEAEHDGQEQARNQQTEPAEGSHNDWKRNQVKHFHSANAGTQPRATARQCGCPLAEVI